MFNQIGNWLCISDYEEDMSYSAVNSQSKFKSSNYDGGHMMPEISDLLPITANSPDFWKKH